jgi:gliding motility-associated protein GldM
MALPKEPRQKMINIMYLVLTALLALNVSAEILNAFKVVDTSLTTSSKNITGANNTLYSSLESKMSEAATREKATYWNGKAQEAKKLSDEMIAYIEGLKKELRQEAGEKAKADGTMGEFSDGDQEAATRLFGKGEGGKNRAEELENRIKNYRTAMLAIDPELGKEFANTLSVDGKRPVGEDGKEKDYFEGYFHMTPAIAGITILSKFQNNIKNSENQLVSAAHSKIGQVKVRFDAAAVLVGQSSNYVMPDEEIKITAGVGAYSSNASPSISINGSSVPVANGVGEYKFKATGSGKKSVNVVVNFKDQDGNMKSQTQTVEYTVGVPGGAAVMLDKMNVFYADVDNPVTIGSPTGWDKTDVTMSGGSISGSGSKRTVRVSAPGTATINVTANGTTTPFQFRCKRIPDPVFKVGSGKARMSTVEFKGQQFCRADLANFDFDLKFNVISANVYFGGTGFPNPATGTITGSSLAGIANLMQRCGPGTSIAFTNIKVQGPGAVRTIDEATIQLY